MLSRRRFLQASALIGCSAAAHPLTSTITLASAPGENRLVVIVLRGAMDGLDVFQPYGDPNLAGLRRTISLGPEQGAHDLDGFFALHSSLSSLLPLWQSGELSFAPSVSTPYRDKRSHFDGQAILEAGISLDAPDFRKNDGWLNRFVQHMPGYRSEMAYSVGIEHMRITSGEAEIRNWAPNVNLRISPEAQELLKRVYETDPQFHASAEQAIELTLQSGNIGVVGKGEKISEGTALARFAATKLNEDTRIASFSIAGWDTHVNQVGTLGRSLEKLSDAILTLRQDLGKNWGKTVVMAMTEFGRTAAENGSGGTDHGTGGTLLIAGGAIKGGRTLGRWPGLGERDLYQGRDLMPVADVRAYAGWAMHDMFGTSREIIEKSVFPGLDMGDHLGILA